MTLDEMKDDPEFDGTDAAHPAWWRGHYYTAEVFSKIIIEIMDGKHLEGDYSLEGLQKLKEYFKRVYEQTD